jgi:hypothetical protein
MSPAHPRLHNHSPPQPLFSTDVDQIVQEYSPVRRDRLVHLELPPIGIAKEISGGDSTTFKAIGDGQITPGEGEMMTNILATKTDVFSRFSFWAGEQPTSLQIDSSSARLLHSGIRNLGLTSFVTGFDSSIMLPGRLFLLGHNLHIFISWDERSRSYRFCQGILTLRPCRWQSKILPGEPNSDLHD